MEHQNSINFRKNAARDPVRNPFWRPMRTNYFGGGLDRPLLIKSTERAADFAERV
jgi:hypothetical protein